MEFERVMLWIVILIAIGMIIFFIVIMCKMATWADRHCKIREPNGDQVDPWEQTVYKQNRDGRPGDGHID